MFKNNFTDQYYNMLFCYDLPISMKIYSNIKTILAFISLYSFDMIILRKRLKILASFYFTFNITLSIRNYIKTENIL